MAEERDVSSTAKARRTAQRHTEPQNLLLDTALPLREMRSSPNQENIAGHESHLLHWGTLHSQKNYDIENFFFLINHTVYSPYIFLPSH